MSRALRRHHRARVITRRLQLAVALYDPDEWVRERPRGEAANDQPWIGCGRPRCGLCRPDKRWHRGADRKRAEREWQRDWGA